MAEEIRRIVEQTAKNGRMLSAPDTAAAILKAYPQCGFDEAEIANEVMLKAANAGVTVQIGREAKQLECSQIHLLSDRGSRRSDRIEMV